MGVGKVGGSDKKQAANEKPDEVKKAEEEGYKCQEAMDEGVGRTLLSNDPKLREYQLKYKTMKRKGGGVWVCAAKQTEADKKRAAESMPKPAEMPKSPEMPGSPKVGGARKKPTVDSLMEHLPKDWKADLSSNLAKTPENEKLAQTAIFVAAYYYGSMLEPMLKSRGIEPSEEMQTELMMQVYELLIKGATKEEMGFRLNQIASSVTPVDYDNEAEELEGQMRKGRVGGDNK